MPARLTRRHLKLGLLTFLTCLFVVRAEAQSSASVREEMYRRYLDLSSYVKGGKVEPHWLADGSSFWYAEGSPDNTVIWKVDPEANAKEPLFDVAKLRKVLTERLGDEQPSKGLPFDTFNFTDKGETTVKFSVEGKKFHMSLDDYAVTPAPGSPEREKRLVEPQVTRKGDNDYPDLYEVRSPDGKWIVGLHDHNLWLRSADDGRRIQLTTNGVEDYEWGSLPWVFDPVWSPDSLRLAVKRHDLRKVSKIPIVHYLKPIEDVQWIPYPFKAGMPTDRHELYVIDVQSKTSTKVEAGGEPYGQIWDVRWLPDGQLLFQENDVYTKKYRIAIGNPKTGVTRTILSETRQAPFIGFPWISRVKVLEGGEEFIWRSEQDGWSHLYLYSADGALVRRLTEGDFPVDRVVTVDEKAGWVYFVARPDLERLFDTHVCRVNLDGSRFEQLTDAPGQHDIAIYGDVSHRVRFSPSNRFFLDSHSSLSRPPTVELRQADGTLLRTLSQATTDLLGELKWSPPESFTVKGADGETDLFGTLYKPYDFDPERQYPVVELHYGAASTVQRTFLPRPGMGGDSSGQALAQLGFIVFGVETHTPWPTGSRSREFDKVVWGNFGRHEIPDQVAALKNLAKTRPYMDLDRVGIMGGSFGGYFATRSLLQYPDVYHVGVAVAPVLDLYTHANYLWLGPPDENKEAYEYASNYRLANNLKGKLLLIQGTSDLSVPISQTMRMIEALIRANKPFDLMILPEWGHWGNERIERYWMDRVADYFQEHLKP